jgi:hypothetical protein
MPGMSASKKPLVGIIMGSKSDWETLQHAATQLDELGVPYEAQVVSAHRTPDLLFDYAGAAAGRGLEVIIAGAGGAAHLPGMIAVEDGAAGARGAGGIKGAQGVGFVAVDRADAGRSAGGGDGDRKSGGDQRGVAGDGNPGEQARKISQGIRGLSQGADEAGAGGSQAG